jgi:hypothetical protein
MSKIEELENAKVKLKECIDANDFKLAMIYCEFAVSLQEAIRADRKGMMEEAYYKAALEHEEKRGIELKEKQRILRNE